MRVAIALLNELKAKTSVESASILPGSSRFKDKGMKTTPASAADQGVEQGAADACATNLPGNGHPHDAPNAGGFLDERTRADQDAIQPGSEKGLSAVRVTQVFQVGIEGWIQPAPVLFQTGQNQQAGSLLVGGGQVADGDSGHAALEADAEPVGAENDGQRDDDEDDEHDHAATATAATTASKPEAPLQPVKQLIQKEKLQQTR